MVAPTLLAEEYQYTDTGVKINSSAASLPFIDITKVSGVDSAPVRQLQMDHDGVDGGYVDSQFETTRPITFEGTIYAPVTNLETYLDTLKANFAPDNTNKPLYFGTDAGLRMLMAKAQGIRYDKDQLRRLGAATCQILFLCEDPRFYTPSLVSSSVSLVAGAIAGRGYNKSYAFGYGAAVTQGSCVVNLLGNRQSPGTLRIDGAVVNPSIINDTTGDTFAFNVTLAAGEYLTVDLATRQVLKNGATNIRSLMTITGNWFMLSPGANSFRIIGTQTPPTPVAQLTVSAYSAWR